MSCIFFYVTESIRPKYEMDGPQGQIDSVTLTTADKKILSFHCFKKILRKYLGREKWNI